MKKMNLFLIILFILIFGQNCSVNSFKINETLETLETKSNTNVDNGQSETDQTNGIPKEPSPSTEPSTNNGNTPTPIPATQPPSSSPSPSSNSFVSVHNAILNQVKGFKNQCNPNGSSTDIFTCGGIAKDSSSGNQWIYSEKEFKVYIPKGTRLGGMKLFLPQKVRTAVVVSLDKPPVRTAPLTLDEYRFSDSGTGWIAGSISESETYRNNEDDSGVGFEKLLRGEEVILIHPGGGIMQVTPSLRRQSAGASPLEQGHWVYIRVINQEDYLYNPQYGFDIDASIYRSWYNTARFDQFGDPL